MGKVKEERVCANVGTKKKTKMQNPSRAGGGEDGAERRETGAEKSPLTRSLVTSAMTEKGKESMMPMMRRKENAAEDPTAALLRDVDQ